MATNGHTYTLNQKAEVSFFFTHAIITRTTLINKGKQAAFYFHRYMCRASKIGSVCFGRLSSQYFSCQQEKSTFLLIKFKHNFCSVSISHLHFLIQSFPLLKQFLRSPGRLFQDKKFQVSQTLNSTRTTSWFP